MQFEVLAVQPSGPSTLFRSIRVRLMSRKGWHEVVGAQFDESGRSRPPILKLGPLALVLALTACNGSDASSSTTANTLQNAPPTTAERTSTTAKTTIAMTTVPPTTPPPTATLPPTSAPPSTTIEDRLAVAIARAQTAERNCYKAAPQPCDFNELEAALVGAQLQRTVEVTEQVSSIEGEDELTWTIKEGPTLKGSDLATAIICRFDPQVVTMADGEVNAEQHYFLQEWTLVPVGDTWKVSDVINLRDGARDPGICES